MENEKLLFQLELKVGDLRRRILRNVSNDTLTLRALLDYGLDKVFLNGYELYIDVNAEGEKVGYLIDGYYLTNEYILDAVVQYENDEIYVDLYNREYDFLQVKVSFKDKMYNDMLDNYMQKQYKKEQQQDDEIPQE